MRLHPVPRLVRTADDRVIVNPGSVGLPAYDSDHPLAPPEQPALYYVETGSPHASYAVVEETEPDWEVSFHRIAYDWESAAACAERNRPPGVGVRAPHRLRAQNSAVITTGEAAASKLAGSPPPPPRRLSEGPKRKRGAASGRTKVTVINKTINKRPCSRPAYLSKMAD